MTSLPFILAGCCCWVLGGATGAWKDHSYVSTGVNGKVFRYYLLFEITARNRRACALRCSQRDACVTFTFHANTCRGHSVRMTSCSASWPVHGACSYVRKTGGSHSAVRCARTGVTYVTDGARGLRALVYCDDVWMVFQRRQDGSVDFYRNWTEYVNGFGDVHGEYWLGLEALHLITTSGVSYDLRVDLMSWNGTAASAFYSQFTVGPAADNYAMSFGGFLCGNAGDSLSSNEGRQFSAWDADHDVDSRNCAMVRNGAWWYKGCGRTNPNGRYKTSRVNGQDGIIWNHFDQKYSLKSCRMMIKPAN